MAGVLNTDKCVVATIVSRHEFNKVVATKVFLNLSRAYLWGEEQVQQRRAKAIDEDPSFEYVIDYECETEIVTFDGGLV